MMGEMEGIGRQTPKTQHPRPDEESKMPTPNERTLFDAEKAQAPQAELGVEAGIPFDVSLLALGSLRGLGSGGLKKLVAVLGDNLGKLLATPADHLAALLEQHKVAGATKLAGAIAGHVEELIGRGEQTRRELEGRGVRVIPPSSLPDQLKSLPSDPPQWLFVQGNEALLRHRPAVAVVGTRQPTREGLRAAMFVCQVLAPYPVVVVSGLAEGIDDEAHRSTLNEGMKNLAFLGHGINVVFPQGTAETRTRLLRSGGAVASEYLPDETYQKRYFVQRNRLQAGLADIVIPVEANPTGGTAHTIRFARQFGRQVIGIRWPGANGILAELQKEGYPVIDILTPSGWKQLDRIIQGLVEQAGHDSYPLAKIEQRVLKEINARDVRREDVLRLIRSLEAAISGTTHDAQPQGRDLRPHDPVREQRQHYGRPEQAD